MHLVDMHVHSTYSDGLMNLDRLIPHALSHGLAGMALTDHDTLDGIDHALRILEERRSRGESDFYFIAGCEFSTWHRTLGEIHMIGYFGDSRYRELDSLLKVYRESRKTRADKIGACLRKEGFSIDIDRIAGDGTVPIGRMHIARELVSKGFFRDTQQAFDLLLRPGTPCYFPRTEIDTFDVISSIHSAGGSAVLAHPTFLYDGNGWKHVEEMHAKGLDGIEYRHPKISRDLATKIEIYAQGRFLLTGGSDYHGEVGRDEMGKYGVKLEEISARFPTLMANVQ